MSGEGIASAGQLKELVLLYPEIKSGCILDTNVLISASPPIDPRNDEAEVHLWYPRFLGME